MVIIFQTSCQCLRSLPVYKVEVMKMLEKIMEDYLIKCELRYKSTFKLTKQLSCVASKTILTR